MIWSLKILGSKQLDIYYPSFKENTVSIPNDLWFQCVCASLKRKHSVLIVLKDFSSFPIWDQSKRWDVSDNWCWLSPRAHSVISSTHNDNPFTLDSFYFYLRSHK